MAKMTAHKHRYDLHPRDATRVSCAICGFSVPLSALKSKHNLDSIVARDNATEAVRSALGGVIANGIHCGRVVQS